MMYSLQQVFAKALELRARYGFDPEKTRLEVTAGLESVGGKKHFSTNIFLKTMKEEWIASAFAVSPEFALAEFERDLMKKTGKVLNDITFTVEEETTCEPEETREGRQPGTEPELDG